MLAVDEILFWIAWIPDPSHKDKNWICIPVLKKKTPTNSEFKILQFSMDNKI